MIWVPPESRIVITLNGSILAGAYFGRGADHRRAEESARMKDFIDLSPVAAALY